MKSLEQVISQLQGYDPHALRAEQVGEFLNQLVVPVSSTESLDLMKAANRVLSEDVISPISVPGHDNSAMDGYAFNGQFLHTNTHFKLKVMGTALAGAMWKGKIQEGECLKIMTGAVMPNGLDTVVPIEMVQELDGSIEISSQTLHAGDNRRLCGEDVKTGSTALSKGTLLRPAALGLLASLGFPKVSVFRRLKVAYFSTGDEVLSLGESPREGAIFDSNRYTIFGMLQRMGIEIVDMGVVRDQPTLLEEAFKQAAEESDAIITSGGVSVGEADHTKTMMSKLGDVAFWRIAMRPGRPMAVGRIGDAILFGLPGNPVAVMVTFLAFVRPALQKMMGNEVKNSLFLKARSQEIIRKKPGRTEYQRGIVSLDAQGALQVVTTGNQGSGVLSSMVEANGLIVLHHEQGNVSAGDMIDVMMFDGVI